MNKQEAKEALNCGEKITHWLFSKNEYIEHENSLQYKDENGYRIRKDEFWKFREGSNFDEGWSIYISIEEKNANWRANNLH